VALGRCPRDALPLTAEAVARAADQARIQALALYKGFGQAVVELAWRAKFKLNVWPGARFRCNSRARNRTVVVDLLFPKMLPGSSLSEEWCSSPYSAPATRSGTWLTSRCFGVSIRKSRDWVCQRAA
jgi:hypothetical protein